MDHSSDTSQQPSATPTPVAKAVVSQRRRRFIQAGVVPVGLTLASRPVMAWHCNTTSAWGSAVLRNGAASSKARADAAVIDGTECWYISDWTGNKKNYSVRGGLAPWSCAQKEWYPTKDATYTQNNLTVSKVFPAGLKNLDGGTKVFKYIKDNPTSFKTKMLVAGLNVRLAQSGIKSCLISTTGTNAGTDMLALMASQGPDVFRPTNSTGAAWSQDQILRYLDENWIVKS